MPPIENWAFICSHAAINQLAPHASACDFAAIFLPSNLCNLPVVHLAWHEEREFIACDDSLAVSTVCVCMEKLGRFGVPCLSFYAFFSEALFFWVGGYTSVVQPRWDSGCLTNNLRFSLMTLFCANDISLRGCLGFYNLYTPCLLASVRWWRRKINNGNC